jgi:hypothetical protein
MPSLLEVRALLFPSQRLHDNDALGVHFPELPRWF